MAYLFADSFDFYSESYLLGLRWDSVSTQGNFRFMPALGTAFGFGQALDCRTLLAGTSTLTESLGSNNSTIFGSIALEWLANSGLSTAYVALVFSDGTNAQCSIVWRGDGSIIVTSGGPTGTVLATYSSAFSFVTWNFWQFAVTINASAGQVQLRINGATSDTYNLTGVDTQAGSGNAYANSISLEVYAPSDEENAFAIDNLFLCGISGVKPDGWLGPMVALGQVPDSDVLAEWSPEQIIEYSTGTTGGTSGIGLTQGYVVVSGGAFLAIPISGNAESVTYNFNSYTGNIIIGLYSGSPASTATLIAQTANINDPSGIMTVDFVTPATVTAGDLYFLAILYDTFYSAEYAAFPTPAYLQAQSFASGFPSTLSGLGVWQSSFFLNGELNITADASGNGFSGVSDPIAYTNGGANTVLIAGGSFLAPPVGASITKLSVLMPAGYTGNMLIGLYSGSPSGTLTLLGYGNVSNPVAGLNTVTLGTPISTVEGTNYYVGVLSDTNADFSYASNGLLSYYVSQSYGSGLPSTISSPSSQSSFWQVGIFYTLEKNYPEVGKFIENETSYVATSTVGNEDRYGLTGTDGADGFTVVGVAYSVLAQNTDVASHSLQLSVAVTGGGDTSLGSESTVPATYQYATFYANKAPTGVSWTGSLVDSAIVGIKLLS